MGTLITISDAYRASLVADGNAGTPAHRVVEIGLATAPFDSSSRSLTQLPGEHKRITTFGARNIAADTIHVTLQDSTNDRYSLYGFGLYLENGLLAAYYSQKAADGPIMEKSPAAVLLLSADMQFVSVDVSRLVFGDATFLNPPATMEALGVVELATQDEVDAGTDASRALTPKTAANRYAKLTGASFTGPVDVVIPPSDTAAPVNARGAGGAFGNEGKIRLWGTFSESKANDTGQRLIASIRAGFNGGAWGREYLDFWLNSGAPNDAMKDSLQTRGMRLVSGGRALFGPNAVDDGVNTLQVAGTVSAGTGTVKGTVQSDNASAFFYASGSGNAFLGGLSTGWTSLVTNNNERVRVTASGRVLFGTLTDDGSNLVQIAGNVSINRTAGEGQIRVGQNDGYFYASSVQAGWYSPTKGAFRYDFGAQNLFVGPNSYAVWHNGNLNPLDKTTGGTISGNVTFATGKRLFLDEGSASFPSLTFVNDGAPDTGLYHVNDGSFGVTCNAIPTVTFSPTVTTFHKPLTGPTPPAGDNSILLATTAWVTSAIASASVGQIVMEPRTSARAGYLKANGAVLNRVDYPALWAYAQASGALVDEPAWSGGSFACFSTGDGAATFRIPELRGEHLRCWDDGRGIDAGRGIGSWQDSQNRSHAHGAWADPDGNHSHSAWTDAQGNHGHHGWTAGVGDHQHVSPWGQSGGAYNPPWGTWGGNDKIGTKDQDGDNTWGLTSPAGGHAHEFNTEGAGNHGHNVGIGAVGNHNHGIHVNADGGAETRVRTVALLAMIRAF